MRNGTEEIEFHSYIRLQSCFYPVSHVESNEIDAVEFHVHHNRDNSRFAIEARLDSRIWLTVCTSFGKIEKKKKKIIALQALRRGSSITIAGKIWLRVYANKSRTVAAAANDETAANVLSYIIRCK